MKSIVIYIDCPCTRIQVKSLQRWNLLWSILSEEQQDMQHQVLPIHLCYVKHSPLRFAELLFSAELLHVS